MKTFIKKAAENGGKIEPHEALFIFLKFMSSVMPTVEYDATVDVKLSFWFSKFKLKYKFLKKNNILSIYKIFVDFIIKLNIIILLLQFS